MLTERTVEQYRSHELLSAYFRNEYVGRVSKSGEVLLKIKGAGIEDNLQKLRVFVDERLAQLTAPGAKVPDIQGYIDAFKRIIEAMSDGHVAMLKAHYLAPGQTITATELAAAANYRNYSAANLQYGIVGKALFDELPIPLPTRKDGAPIYTFALAEAGERNGDEDHWHWKMRPQVAAALEYLGLIA